MRRSSTSRLEILPGFELAHRLDCGVVLPCTADYLDSGAADKLVDRFLHDLASIPEG